jgi:ribonucleoside-diphosphate reductase alpha chain
MQKVWEEKPALKEKALAYGCRFTHHSSIAPTGTISLVFGNNVSNGIEPSYTHKYVRNIIKQGKKAKVDEVVYAYELLLYKQVTGKDDAPIEWSTSNTVTPKEHVDVQAVAQYWLDSACSKTINVPRDTKFEDFKNIYMYAYDKKLKGCTTYRFNPEAFSGVLVQESDLENTTYSFILEDGTKVSGKGNDRVVYEGEEYSVQNLFDAFKEGYYGKY